MRTLNYNQAIALVRLEQLVDGAVHCPFCLFDPKVATLNDATEPHHWLFKRSANVPQEVQDDPKNIILICKYHHDKIGQTREARLWAYRWKSRFYEIEEWVEQVVHDRLIRVRPGLPDIRPLSEVVEEVRALKKVDLDSVTIPQKEQIMAVIDALDWVLNRRDTYPGHGLVVRNYPNED